MCNIQNSGLGLGVRAAFVLTELSGALLNARHAILTGDNTFFLNSGIMATFAVLQIVSGPGGGKKPSGIHPIVFLHGLIGSTFAIGLVPIFCSLCVVVSESQ